MLQSAWVADWGKLELTSDTTSRGSTAWECAGAGFTSEIEAWKLSIEIRQQSGSDEAGR